MTNPSSEFILKRIIKNDMQQVPGWGLNVEMRMEFSRMMRELEERKEQGHGR